MFLKPTVGAVWSGSTLFASILKLTNKQAFSDAVILKAFEGLDNVFCVFTKVLWHKIKQLLSNKTTTHF